MAKCWSPFNWRERAICGRPHLCASQINHSRSAIRDSFPDDENKPEWKQIEQIEDRKRRRRKEKERKNRHAVSMNEKKKK